MRSENPVNDAKLICKAFVSNQLARFAPKLYMKATRETGRGKEAQDPADIARYFTTSFDEYFERLGVEPSGIGEWLAGKRVLEYGPGDTLGVAFLFHAHGAASVRCVDRFPLQTSSASSVAVYARLLASLSGEVLQRARRAFVVEGDPASPFRADAIEYQVARDGLSRGSRDYDLIISRAVMEHVNDLDGTLADVAGALKPDGLSIHQVDLRSHGLDRYRPFDFLTWPENIYRLMFSHKGFPNRWRIDRYREAVRAAGLALTHVESTGCLSQADVAAIAPDVAPRFRDVPLAELGWLGFWMTLRPIAADAGPSSRS